VDAWVARTILLIVPLATAAIELELPPRCAPAPWRSLPDSNTAPDSIAHLLSFLAMSKAHRRSSAM